MIGLVDHPTEEPHVEVLADDDLRSAAADLTRDVAAQSQAVLDVAIGVLAEAHIGHPHDASALDLLGLTRRAGLGGRHGRDPGLAAGEEEVVDLDACLGPAVHRR